MRVLLALLAALLLPLTAQAQTIIAHRGVSGERPEATLAAFDRAIDQGADWIEFDLVPSKDGVLVARHESALSGTTDVADRAEFADRRVTKTIDGETLTDWFAEDFTLAELRTLRAKERLPALRPANARFDGLYQVPTLAEIIALVRARELETGRTIGIYPELKHPTYFALAGFDTPALLVTALDAAGYRGPEDAAIIQCFEIAPLLKLSRQTGLRLVQLIAKDGGPADLPAMTYAAMREPGGLAVVARYASGIAAEASLLLEEDGTPNALVTAAHAAGLTVHAWTLRRENAFLPPPLRRGEDPAAEGDFAKAWTLLARAGADGIITDHPGQALAVRQALSE